MPNGGPHGEHEPPDTRQLWERVRDYQTMTERISRELQSARDTIKALRQENAKLHRALSNKAIGNEP